MSRYRYEKERAAFIARALPNLASPKQLRDEKQVVADLFEKYPDMKFWRGLKMPFELNSLVYFFCPKGRVWLHKAYVVFSFEKAPASPKPVFQKSKVGEDRIIKSKPRTLKEFLNV